MQDRTQTIVSQICQYHAFSCSTCPCGEEEPYPAEAERAQKDREGVEERAQHGGHEENGFGAMALNEIGEADIEATAVALCNQASTGVAGEVGADGACRLTNSSHGANHGGIQYPAHCEGKNNAKAWQNERSVGENADDEETQIAKSSYLFDVLCMMDYDNR
jgi:hypothetical protein